MSVPRAMGDDALYVALKDEIRRISAKEEFGWFLAVQDGISNFDAHWRFQNSQMRPAPWRIWQKDTKTFYTK